jgi:hypothetical protein
MSAYCWSLTWETLTGENKRHEKMKWVFNEYFSSQDTVYRDIVHYLILYGVIRNQYMASLLHSFFSLIPSPLILVGGREIWLPYLDSAMSNYKNDP